MIYASKDRLIDKYMTIKESENKRDEERNRTHPSKSASSAICSEGKTGCACSFCSKATLSDSCVVMTAIKGTSARRDASVRHV